MRTLAGRALCPGVAMGPLHVVRGAERSAPSALPCGGDQKARFEGGRLRALERLDVQYRRALETAGEEGAGIFRLHRLMLEDEDYLDAVRRALARGLDAEEAALAAGEQMAAALEGLEDPYLRERAADVREVSWMVAGILSGTGEAVELSAPSILAAADLTPGQLIGLEREDLLGLVLRDTSPQGHTALLARAMGVPVVAGLDPDPAWEGLPGGMDGGRGLLYLEPDGETRRMLAEEDRRARERAARLRALADAPDRTADGREVPILANIGCVEDADLALEQGARGVGLFRTEFLCLDRSRCPSEEEQFQIYRQVAQRMAGRPVVIRTLDIGGDKRPPWLPAGRGQDPALGLRGIRLSLDRPELFRPQLRAMLRAAALGNVAVLLPMVTSPEEVRQAREILTDCSAQLEGEGLPHGPVELGVMIETPAAALLADRLAREADFFSIGTNDLAQYTLAMGRQDPELAGRYDPGHPAVLELVRMAAEAGHRHGKRVALCGQLGADTDMTKTLLELGVDELSVSPPDILPLRERVRSLDLSRG